jgi:hypothetical protein
MKNCRYALSTKGRERRDKFLKDGSRRIRMRNIRDRKKLNMRKRGRVEGIGEEGREKDV